MVAAWFDRRVCSVECDDWAPKIRVAFFGCTSSRRLSWNVRAEENATWTHHLPNKSETTLCHRPWPNGPEIGARTIWIHCARWKLHSQDICDISTAGGAPYKSHMRRNKTAKLMKSVKTSRVFFVWARLFDWMRTTLVASNWPLIVICIIINANTRFDGIWVRRCDKLNPVDNLLTPGRTLSGNWKLLRAHLHLRVISNYFCTGSAPESSSDISTKIVWRRWCMWSSYSEPTERQFKLLRCLREKVNPEDSIDVRWKERRSLWQKILELGIRWSSYLSARLYSQPWTFI